jgi:hypothetical protein
MKTKSLLIAFMVLLTLNYGNAAIATEKKAKAKNRITVPSKGEKYDSIIPFDINRDKLPPNFTGTDIVKLFSVLAKKAPLTKGEFDTTIDYKSRIESAISPDVYAFRLDFTSGKFADSQDRYGISGYITYDADIQKFKIALDIDDNGVRSPFREGYKDHKAYIIVKEIKHPSLSYIGSNAFGATRLVDSYRDTQYLLAFENTVGLKSGLEINISPAQAKKMNNRIGVLLLCKTTLHETTLATKNTFLGNALIFEYENYSEATIDNPISLRDYRKCINVEVLAVWLYDNRTGDILLKQNL